MLHNSSSCRIPNQNMKRSSEPHRNGMLYELQVCFVIGAPRDGADANHAVEISIICCFSAAVPEGATGPRVSVVGNTFL